MDESNFTIWNLARSKRILLECSLPLSLNFDEFQGYKLLSTLKCQGWKFLWTRKKANNWRIFGSYFFSVSNLLAILLLRASIRSSILFESTDGPTSSSETSGFDDILLFIFYFFMLKEEQFGISQKNWFIEFNFSRSQYSQNGDLRGIEFEDQSKSLSPRVNLKFDSKIPS